MSRLLRWRPGARGDRLALQAFTCTEAPKTLNSWGRWTISHPRPWERFVQAKVRTMKPPYPPPEHLLLGWDDAGIGAAVFWEELDGPGQVEVYLGAVAMRYRRRGGGVADEMMTELFDAITERAFEVGVDMVEISTWIHEGNRASQSMARRFTFHQTSFKEDEQLQRWSVFLQIDGSEP